MTNASQFLRETSATCFKNQNNSQKPVKTDCVQIPQVASRHSFIQRRSFSRLTNNDNTDQCSVIALMLYQTSLTIANLIAMVLSKRRLIERMTTKTSESSQQFGLILNLLLIVLGWVEASKGFLPPLGITHARKNFPCCPVSRQQNSAV